MSSQSKRVAIVLVVAIVSTLLVPLIVSAGTLDAEPATSLIGTPARP